MGRARPLAALAVVSAVAAGGPVAHCQIAASHEAEHRPPFEGMEVLERKALITAVLDRNPGLEAARQAWRAAGHGMVERSSLGDPTVSYAVAPLSAVSDTRYGQVLHLSQRLPFPGTLRLRSEAAQAEAEIAEGRLGALRLRLATRASLLFDRLYLVARKLEIHAEHQQLLEDFRRVATRRYGAGLLPQQAPLQAEVESAHLMHLEAILRTEEKRLTAQLNALLHRPPGAALPPPPGELPPPEMSEPAAGAVAAALDRRPEVRAQRAEVEARKATVGMERLDAYPGFEVSTSFNSMWGPSDYRWTVGVGINVPIRRKRIRAGVARAEARLAAAESELERLGDQVRQEAEIVRLEIEKAHHVIRLYEDRVLPAARDQVAAATAGFETGAITMLALIDAERSLRTAEVHYHQAVAEALSRRAELDRALGRLPFSAAAGGAPMPVAEETER